jgi:dTDP-4-dehydrorhamnose reductase
MAKVIVLGSNGMAGHLISTYLREQKNHVVVDLKRPEFDVLSDDWKEVIRRLLHGFSKCKEKVIIINCIGLLKKESNLSPINAIRINSLFPHELALLGKEGNAKIIHLSTDCWKDEDYYGRSKRAGEILCNHTTLRTSIVGPELKKDGSGLFHWFMNQNGTVDGYCNHLWDGVTTLELAKVISDNLESLPEGIVELRSEKPISKYELLCVFKDVFQRKVDVQKKQTEIVDKTAKSNIPVLLTIPEQVRELKKWVDAHLKMYKQVLS